MSDPIPKYQKRLSQLSQIYSMDRYSELTTATTSSAGHINTTTNHHTNHNSNVNNEWQSIDNHLRELEEAKTRLSQMEKTMKWWSDCTSNWREKWRKVRNERNKAREESKLLLNKLECVNKEVFILKKEKSDYECEIMKLENEIKQLRIECSNKQNEHQKQLSNSWCHNCQRNINNNNTL